MPFPPAGHPVGKWVAVHEGRIVFTVAGHSDRGDGPFFSAHVPGGGSRVVGEFVSGKGQYGGVPGAVFCSCVSGFIVMNVSFEEGVGFMAQDFLPHGDGVVSQDSFLEVRCPGGAYTSQGCLPGRSTPFSARFSRIVFVGQAQRADSLFEVGLQLRAGDVMAGEGALRGPAGEQHGQGPAQIAVAAFPDNAAASGIVVSAALFEFIGVDPILLFCPADKVFN